MPMKKKVEEKVVYEKFGEDWCYCCYEGGELRICDYKDCQKSYHTHCLNKDESFLEDEIEWFCGLHTCYKCHESSNVHCICCPKSVCGLCIGKTDVVQIKGETGMCSRCLNLALMIEKKIDYDSDGDFVDFYDLRTEEGLFREYWEIVNQKEGLTVGNLESADAQLIKCNIKKRGNKKGKCNKKKSSSNLEERYKCEFSEISDSDGSNCAKKRKSKQKIKPSKNQSSVNKRKVTKADFVGWGSKSLIQFLESIYVDVSKNMSQRIVSAIISRYIRDNKLFDPDKKKKVVCDAKLQSLFGRKTLNKHKISAYLERHFAENRSSSEDDKNSDDSEDENSLVSKRQRTLENSRKFPEVPRTLDNPRKLPEVPRFNIPQRHYASICPSNINLVYLKRTLVQKLLEEPDTFESKLIGSFVKVKSDPNDFLRRKPHHLMKVTGITRESSGENTMQVLLEVLGSTFPVGINYLSDCDITEEDCEELKQGIKSGLLKQPTIAELKEKAEFLHKERMSHWIARELRLLQIRSDQANEKGWRRELHEYWDAQDKLEKSREQLMQKVPEVIAGDPIAGDPIELDSVSEGIRDDKEEEDNSHRAGPEEKGRHQIKAYKSLHVPIVDLTSDEHDIKKNAATQTEDFDHSAGLASTVSPEKVPSIISLDQWKDPKSASPEYELSKAGESNENDISLSDAVAMFSNKKKYSQTS